MVLNFFSRNIKSKYVIVKDLKVHYLKAGFNPFSKVIFLHGLGAGCEAYKEAISIIARKHEVYAIDFPSFGKTQLLNKPWKIKDFSEYVENFRKTMNLGKITLVGHSAGGMISIELASSNKNIKKLVLIDSAGLKRHMNDAKFMIRLAFMNPVNHYFELKKNMKLKSFYSILKNTSKIIMNNIREKNMNIFKTLLNNWSYNCEKKISKIKINTYIIWGDKDELFPIEDAYYLKKKIKNSKITVINGYHNWICFSPENGEKELKKI